MPNCSRTLKESRMLSAPVPAVVHLCMRAKRAFSVITGIVPLLSGKTISSSLPRRKLDDTGDKYVNFKLEFPAAKGRRK